ncbi:MAG: hypothetical protein ACI9TF_001272 [Paracrocinitomix sp.]|jgi:hypothetical protein
MCRTPARTSGPAVDAVHQAVAAIGVDATELVIATAREQGLPLVGT